MNLLEETKDDIRRSGHTPKDIVFIGSEETGHRCTWDQYQALANIDYSSGFGAAEIAQDLKIVFSDGSSMKRGEYDGSEWWEYARPFTEPKIGLTISRLMVDRVEEVGWRSLGDMNPVVEEQ